MALNDYLEQLKPREKAILEGVDKLSDIELLSIVLRTGNKEEDVISLSNTIINKIGGLYNLNNISYTELLQFKGIGKVKAIEILAIIQISNRMNEINIENYVYAKNPEIIFELFKKKFDNVQQEHFIVLSLNAKNAIIDNHTVFIGTLSQSLIHPRDIFRRIISNSASSFIILHNHPSGDPNPSSNDLEVTEHLTKIASLFAIPLLDHIIIGKETYYSFKENEHL